MKKIKLYQLFNIACLLIFISILLPGNIFAEEASVSSSSPNLSPTSSISPTESLVPTVSPTVLNFNLVNYVQTNLPEQDVFIERVGSPSKDVFRIEKAEISDPKKLSKSVYATAKATEHDFFKIGSSSLGPFTKGKSLGFALSDWLLATGSGSYSVVGEEASMSLVFGNLVPRGVYSVWCSRLTLPPNPEMIDRPCGNPDGSENSFKVDSKGNGQFSLKIPALEVSSEKTYSVITAIYHSDGKTHGNSPGEYGKTAHGHLYYLLPAPPTPSPTATPIPTPVVNEIPTPNTSKATVFIIAFLAILVVAVLIFLLKRRN